MKHSIVPFRQFSLTRNSNHQECLKTQQNHTETKIKFFTSCIFIQTTIKYQISPVIGTPFAFSIFFCLHLCQTPNSPSNYDPITGNPLTLTYLINPFILHIPLSYLLRSPSNFLFQRNYIITPLPKIFQDL